MQSLDTLQLVSLAAALGWASGIRLYVVLFVVGLVGHFDWMALPSHLDILSHPMVLAASGGMVVVEFVADKVPWFDSLWDGVHTFIRIPAGAALAAGVFGDSGAASAMAAAIIGGSLAAGSHVTKTGTRALANTSPEPFSNWGLSLTEDVAVGGGLLLALTQPWIFLALLLAVVLLMLWLMPKLWRAAQRVLRRVSPAPPQAAQ